MSDRAEVEGSFALASRLASRSLAKARKLPHSDHRARAIDNLQAAIGWLKQARDDYATELARGEL